MAKGDLSVQYTFGLIEVTGESDIDTTAQGEIWGLGTEGVALGPCFPLADGSYLFRVLSTCGKEASWGHLPQAPCLGRA